MKTLFFLSFSLLFSFFTCAQTNLDSLWGVWNDESAPDTSKAKALQIIAKEGYQYTQPDSCFYFAQMLYDFAREKGLKMYMVDALNIQGVSYYNRGEFSTALEYYQQSLKIGEDISYKRGLAITLNNIGIIHVQQGNYSKSMYYYQRSFKIKEEMSDKKGMAKTLNNIGTIYVYQGDYPNALDYYMRCLNIKEEISDHRGMAGTYNNIALIYTNLGDYTKALENVKRSLKIKEGLNDISGIAGNMNNLGYIYTKLEEFDKAMEYYRESLKIKEELSDKKGIANALNNIGEVYLHQKDYKSANEYFHRSLKIKEEISDRRGMASTMNNIGKTSFELGDIKQAVFWCEKGLQTSKEIKILEIEKNSCQCLYDAYKAMGNNAKALTFHEQITLLNDSLQVKETTKKLQQMEFARQIIADSLLQEEEKLRIQLANEAEVRKKNRSRNIFILSGILLLMLAIGIHRRMVFVRKAKRAIENEKERSDILLLNILPVDIADELKAKGRADARKFENVSILFTDFKQFTEISEKIGAEELVEEINTCFEPFDAICKKYGIEKIKTIGDSYMAAGGLPVPTDDSVKNTVLAGIEMTDFVINRKLEQESKGKLGFEMRVGIHTGPVVAGIVGVSKFQYDIWGDTVNFASRIENVGEAGKVNISHSTYELIKDDPAFKFEARGTVTVKGKEDVEMWFVSASN